MKVLKRSLQTESSAKHGVALSVTAGLLNIGVNIALFPLVLHTIGAAQYGIWLIITAISQYFFYSDLGIGSAIVHFASRGRGGSELFSFDQLISNGVAWASTILLVVMPVFLIISYSYTETHAEASGLTDEQAIGIIVMGALLLASIVIRPFESILIGSGHLALNMAHQIAGSVLRVVLIVALCLTNADVTAIAAAEAASLCLGPVLATIYVLRKRIARPRIADVSVANVRGLFRYSLKTFAVDVVSVGTLYAGTILVGVIKGPASAAYFALAMKVFNGAGQIIRWATAPALPIFSKLWHSDAAGSRSLVRDLLKVVATAGCVGIVPIALSSVLWLPHWIDEEGVALGTGLCVVIVLVALMSNVILDPIVLLCDSYGRPGVIFFAQAALTVLFIAIGIPLTSKFGIVGAAASLAVAMWIVQPLCLPLLSRTLNMRLRSDIATCYRLPALILLVGGALAFGGGLLASSLQINAGWLTTPAFLLGAGVVIFGLPIGRDAVLSARRLLELPM